MDSQKKKFDKQPVLLRIPLSTLTTNQDGVPSINKQVKLLKSTKQNIEESKPLLRLPLTKENNVPIFVNTGAKKQEPLKPPKLIDLRSILNIRITDEKVQALESKTKTPADKNPQLIRLPNINVKQTQLLESPKREKPKEKRRKPKDPNVIDVRQHGVFQSSNDKQNEILKNSRNATVQTSPRRAPNPSPMLLSPPTFHQRPSKQETSRRKSRRQHHSLHTSETEHHDREDQLFNIINELLQRRSSKKKKKKRLRLFDIIDNIPVTSPEDNNSTTECDTPPKHSHRIKPRKLDSSTKDALVNYGLTSFPKAPSYLGRNITEPSIKTFDPLPGPPSNSTNHQNNTNNRVTDPSDSWLNLINTLNNKNRSDDDLDKFEDNTWRDLKRLTRNENKETQTLKPNNNDSEQQQHRTKEVQTEMKDMIDIPRTQTFFATTGEAEQKLDACKTQQFCNRVREEVIKKLEYQEQLEDKTVQTVCHAEAQTDSTGGGGGGLRNTSPIDVNKATREVVRQPSHIPPQDPTIYHTLKLTTNTDKHFEDTTSTFINVTNIDQSDEPPKKQLLTPRTTEATSHIRDEIQDAGSPIHSMDEFQKKTKRTMASLRSKAPSSPPPRSTVKQSSQNTGKARLIDDIDDFTQGIEALEHLQENIQRELKSTRMLFNTVEILQDGFNGSDDKFLDTSSRVIKEDESTEFVIEPVTHLEGMETSTQNIMEDQKDIVINDIFENEATLTRNENASQSSSRHLFTEEVNLTSSFNASHFTDPYNNNSLHYGDNNEMLFSPRVARRSHLAMSSLIERLSEDDDNDGDDSEEGEARDDEEQQQRLLDEQKKDEIRRRLQIANEEEKEREAKTREAAKREKLRDWMRDRQDVERKKYLGELEEKRATEYKPFKSQATFTRRQINNNMTFNDETKRATLADDNRQRLDEAEQLARGMMNEPTANPSRKIRRSSTNNRYNASPAKIPLIRETRSSRMRKNALIADVIRHDRTQLRQKTSRVKPLSKSTKTKAQKKSKRSLETSEMINQFSNFDQSYEIVNAGHDSPRVTVHPDEFVTGQSFEHYWKHRSPEKSLDASSWKRNLGSSTVMEHLISPRSRHTYGNKQSSIASRKPTVDNQNVKDILTSYGLDLDNSLFQERSETSNLLNEVDLALIQEGDTMNSTLTNNQSVDWNEVDRILNE